MRYLSYRLPRTLFAFGGIAALVLAGVFSLAVGGTAHAAAQSATTQSASRGHATLVATVIPTKLAAQHGSASTTPTSAPQLRRAPLRLATSGAHAANAKNTPHVASTKHSKLGALLHNFDGINAIQNRSVNPFDVEPPDEGLAAGNGYVFNIVNQAGAIYRPNGETLAGPFSATAFFAEPATAFLSDPRDYYDASTHHWFALIFEFSSTESHIDLAVSTTANPLNAWRIYRINSTDPGGAGCPCFPDYTIFGIDQYNVYLSGNEFSINGSNFNGAEIWAVSKSQLESGVAANYAYFPALSQAGAPAYHVQPAISYSNPNAEYFMNSLDPNSTFDNRLGVWAMTNRESVTTGHGMPILSSIVIGSEAYGFPPNAVTPPGFDTGLGAPTTGIVASDFDAMQEVEYINGHLVGALDTAVTIPGDTASRSGVAWFQVAPHLSGEVIGGAHVQQQGYLASQGLYLLYPHINQGRNGADVMTFSFGGPGTYLSAAYAVKKQGAKNFGTILVAAAGVDPDNGFTGTTRYGGVGRWGDYSNGEVDLSNNTVWLATQYIPNNGDKYANWGNRIFQVQL